MSVGLTPNHLHSSYDTPKKDIVSCNDIIAAVPDNPIVKDIILKCLQNYARYDKSPVTFVSKKTTKSVVVKDKHILSKMDIKRIPAKSTVVNADGSVQLIGLHHATINRHSLTIDASGPTNTSLALAERISSMPVQMRNLNFINYSLFFNKTTSDETILAGKVICNARPSLSWIKEGRPTKAFDDTAMQDSQACLQRMINPKK